MNTTNAPLPIPTIDLAGRAADDPRCGFDRAAATAGVVIGAVNSSNADRPTPCDDWTADELARHMVAVMIRTAGIGRGQHPDDLPLVIDPVSDLSGAWEEAVADSAAVWADASLLQRNVVVPWATIPGAVMMSIYSSELLVHSWDLATGIDVDLDWIEADVAAALAVVQFGIPAEPRGDEVPFAPVGTVADDAPTIDKLAAWMGRQP